MSHPPTHTNRLIHEKSPYLLQHAHNPVDWYPWGNEAFQLAKDEGKPIFLSIGYATCHWCHVMEKESFESVEVAKLMNETFINIKVDREELPEVDNLYMEFAQAMMSGGAGWPLNLVLTPDLMPFFAATYLPADATRGFLGMKQLVNRIQQIWENREERENVESQAGKIVDVFAEHIHTEGNMLPDLEHIEEAAELLFKTADPIYGGTKGAPKFPIGIQALFLLHLVLKSTDSRALFYVERTLGMMHRGGIYDHLGGGFSRYSIDDQWLVPHFEKMLYDNAILARVYLEAWEYTRQPLYKEIAEHILTYLLRDMHDPQGGFYSAEDADTEGKEGLFYTWTWDEIEGALGTESHLFAEFYGVVPGGNFEGRNILHIPHTEEEFAARHRVDVQQLKDKLAELRQRLWTIREKRPHPAKDDKILAAWNGLMIHALAKAGAVLQKPVYFEEAEKCARFIQTNMWREGTLLRRWCDGDVRFDGCLDDYAYMIHGLLTLFETDRGSEWLEFALALNSVLDSEFKAENGAYYMTDGKDPNLLLRRCEFYDGAEPSGNAIQAENLIRLFQITGDESYLIRAEDVFRACRDHIELYPPGACYHLMALERYYDNQAPTFVIALNEEESHREELFRLFSQRYTPHAAVVWCRESDEELRDLAPLSRGKPPIEGKTTLYLCYGDRCLLPITDFEEMRETIEKM